GQASNQHSMLCAVFVSISTNTENESDKWIHIEDAGGATLLHFIGSEDIDLFCAGDFLCENFLKLVFNGGMSLPVNQKYYSTYFWEDIWLGSTPLQVQYP
ncbi:hypothetical protein ACJX0J_012105, partial [Zea mays]